MLKLKALILAAGFALGACGGKSLDVVPVTNFETDRYLGTWYEVARLDHSFERGLTNVTATYSKREDGLIRVANRGLSAKTQKYKDAEGRAKFKSDETTGHLKVSFFGPFFGDYIIFDLDKANYSYAYISGGRDSYLWLLSRTPEVPDAVRQDFITQSKALGYKTDDLIWVEQSAR